MKSDTLRTFSCSRCGEDLGWTAPGEASRIGKRAKVFCNACKARPSALSDRQEDLVLFMNAFADEHEGTMPSLSVVADALGVSKSRAQQLRDSVLARRPELLSGQAEQPAQQPAPTLMEAVLTATPEPPRAQFQHPTMRNPQEDPAAFGGEFV